MKKMRKVTDDPRQLIWVSRGNFTTEASQIIQKNVRETGADGSGAPSVLVRQYPGGEFTILAADPEWWSDEMRLHPEWGQPFTNDDEFLSLLESAGVRPEQRSRES